MKIVIYSDVHRFGVHDLKDLEFTYGDNVYHLGDNVDLKGCKKKKVKKALAYMREYKQLCSNHYISGNHDLGFDKTEYIEKEILFTHGDRIFWDQEKSDSFRRNTPGRGSFGRFLSWLGHKWRKNHGPTKWDKKDLIIASNHAKANGCKTFICGHKHPLRMFDEVYDGVRCICVRRGRTELDI